jgi:hypothetical protein
MTDEPTLPRELVRLRLMARECGFAELAAKKSATR